MATTWDEEKDVEFTRMRLARTPVKEMALRFGTTVGAVYAHARVLKAFVMDRKAWTNEEATALLALDDADVPIRDMARRLDRSEQSVSWKLGDLGREAKRMRYWKDDDARVRAMAAGKATPEAIAARLNRSVESVRDRMCFLGLGETRNRWDLPEAERLKAMVEERMAPEAIAVALGREVGSVRAKAYAMGLRFAGTERVLTDEEVEALREALKGKGGLAAFAAVVGVSTRSLRGKARAAGLSVQTRRRRALDANEARAIADAARGGMAMSEAMTTFGRDSRTLKEVAAREGASFPARAKAVPKARMFKVRTSKAIAPMAERPLREAAKRPLVEAVVAAPRTPAVREVVREVAFPKVEAPKAAASKAAPRSVTRGVRATAARPVTDRAAMDTAVSRFLAFRAVTKETLDPVEETVRAIRRKGYAVVRDADSFVVDGRTRLGDTEELVSFALARSIEVPVALRAAA